MLGAERPTVPTRGRVPTRTFDWYKDVPRDDENLTKLSYYQRKLLLPDYILIW